MKITKFIIIVILIVCFSINLVSASNVNELPIDVQLDENIPWVSYTNIITPFGDTAKVEIIFHYHLPMSSINQSTAYSYAEISIPGTLESDIELYINNEKKDFNEYFNVVNNREKFSIKSNTDLTIRETTDLKFIFLNKQPGDLIFSYKKNSIMVRFTADISIIEHLLFRQFIFRVPTVNAQNIKIDVHNSVFKDSKNILTGAPISKISTTDKYIDINYIFWNDGMVNQIIKSNRSILTKKRGNEGEEFQTEFSIEYDTVRVDWIIQAIVVAILLTVTFYFGERNGKKKA